MTIDFKEIDIPEFNYGITGFDNIWQAMLTVFQIMTGVSAMASLGMIYVWTQQHKLLENNPK